MSAIVNARDALLQAASPRVEAVNLPSNINVPNLQVLGLGALALLNAVSATTQVTGLGDLATQNTINLATQVTGALASGNVSGLGALALLNAVDLATQTTGTLSNASVSGLGALATQSAVNLATQVSGALSYGNVSGLGSLATQSSVNAATQVYNLGSLAFANSLAANQIAAGTFGAGVAYIGTVNASQVNSGILSGISIQIGTGHTPNGKAFEVNFTSGGSPVFWVDNVTGGVLSGANGNYAAPALQGTTYRSGYSGVVGLVASGYPGGHGMDGQNVPASCEGIVGHAGGYAFKAISGTAGPFTGSHDTVIHCTDDVERGDIVVDVEKIAAYSLSDTLFRVERSSTAYSKRAIGVALRRNSLTDKDVPPALVVSIDPDYEGDRYFPEFYDLLGTHDNLIVNAVGEGQINVCGENGNIDAGDFIVTSSMPGKGMKQADDAIRSYTVARSRESVTFADPFEVKTIACIYLAG